MKTKSIFCLAVFAVSVMLFSNCKKDRTKHSREISNVQNIRGIVVEGSWSVYLSQGEQSSAKIEYSAFLIIPSISARSKSISLARIPASS